MEAQRYASDLNGVTAGLRPCTSLRKILYHGWNAPHDRIERMPVQQDGARVVFKLLECA